MRNIETGNLTIIGILFLTLLLLLLLPTTVRTGALDVTYTLTTTFTTSITDVSTREVYEIITRTQTSTWYSAVTDRFTTEGPAPQIEILSQRWEPPLLFLVLYNAGGPGIVTIGLYGGGRYLGSIQVRAPTPGQTVTYSVKAPVEAGVVSAVIVNTQGDPVAVTTTRVETYTGKTVVLETHLRTRYFVTSIEERLLVSTFVGTRTGGFFEDPFQRTVLTLFFGGLAGVGVVAGLVATRLKQAKRPEEEREEEEKRRTESRLIWSVIPPTKLRVGGHIQIFNQVTNSGEIPATDVILNGAGPAELEFAPTLKIGIVNPKDAKALPFKVSCRRGAAKKEYPLTLTLTCVEEPPQSRMMPIFVDILKVGLLIDFHNVAYSTKRGMASAPAEAMSTWVLANNFDYDIFNEAEDIAVLQRYNVVLSSSQYSLSDRDINALKQYVSGGGGLVALDGVGVVEADAFQRGEASYSGSQRVIDLFGYSSPLVVEIVRGLQGIRVADSAHPITRGLGETMISLPRQAGLAFYSPPSTSKMLADQRVMVAGKFGYVGIAAVTANEYGNGRVVHFNLSVAEHVHFISSLLDKALLWAARFV